MTFKVGALVGSGLFFYHDAMNKSVSWRAGLLIILLAGSVHGRAADAALKVVDADPPKELSEAVRKTLQNKAVQLLKGDKPIYEFWLNGQTPITAKPESESKSL